MRRAAASLLAPRGFFLVHHKAVHAKAEIGAQLALRRIVFSEQFAFEHFGEESLRQILRIFGRPIPSQAHVFVDWLPVRGKQSIQGPRLFRGISALNRVDHRPTRYRKLIASHVFLRSLRSTTQRDNRELSVAAIRSATLRRGRGARLSRPGRRRRRCQ